MRTGVLGVKPLRSSNSTPKHRAAEENPFLSARYPYAYRTWTSSGEKST